MQCLLIRGLEQLGDPAAAYQVDRITTDLATYPGRDAAVHQWRLLLAFHDGQAGYPATAQQLLAPIIGGGTAEQQDAAQAVLRARDGPRSDIRLQIIILETELHATPRNRRRGPSPACNSPTTPTSLTTYANIARWTGDCVGSAAALRFNP